MADMFGSKMPEVEKPKPIRMPVETDPEVLAAGQRTRKNALSRSGRLSTIMTDAVSSASSGEKLGA